MLKNEEEQKIKEKKQKRKRVFNLRIAFATAG